jgi:hypothetical protein
MTFLFDAIKPVMIAGAIKTNTNATIKFSAREIKFVNTRGTNTAGIDSAK